MSLKERVYSVLVVSASEKFNDALYDMLPDSTYSPIETVSDISSAKRMIAERAFDFVIINSPLTDDLGTRFAVDACAREGTVVLLIVRADCTRRYMTRSRSTVYLLCRSRCLVRW